MKSVVWTWVGMLVVVSMAKGAWAGAENTPNVFSDDARGAVSALAAPSKWIGKLVLPGGGWCTAGLISHDLILTAAHCIMDGTNHTLSQGNYQFRYGYIGGKYADTSGVSHFWWGTTHPQDNRADDWAILRLSSALGDKYGWMGVRALDIGANLNSGNIGMTSYGSDFYGGETPSAEKGCSFTDTQWGGTVLHNCDMSRGASGAPMYRPETDDAGNTTYYVVAINVADYRDGKDQSLTGIPYSSDHANIAVPAARAMPTLLSILHPAP